MEDSTAFKITGSSISTTRLVITLCILVTGICATWFIKLYIDNTESTRIRFEAERLTTIHSVAIWHEILHYQENIDALAGLFDASEFVTGDEFNRFASRVAYHHNAMELLAWVQRTPPTEISAADTTASTNDTENFKLQYRWPADANLGKIENSLILNKTLQQMLTRTLAVDNRQSTILEQDHDNLLPGILIMAPVTHQHLNPSSPSDTMKQEGVAIGIVSLQAIIDQVLKDNPVRNLYMQLVENSNPASPRVLSQYSGPIAAEDTLMNIQISLPLDIEGMSLAVTSMPLQGFLDQHASGYSLYVLVAGILISVLLSLFYYRTGQYRSLLEMSEQHYRQMTEQATDIMGLIYQDSEIIYGNPAVESILGYKPKTLQSRKVLDIIHPEDVPVLRHAIEEVINHKAGKMMVETRTRHAQDYWCWVEAVLSIGPEVDDKPTVHCVVRDIDRRKRTEMALDRTTRALHTLSACNSAMIRSVSERNLIDRLPGILVREGAYPLVWFGRLENNDMVRVLSYASANEHFTLREQQIHIPLRELSPISANAEGEDKYEIWSPYQHQSSDPFHTQAIVDDCHTAITFRIEDKKNIFGILTVFSKQREAFDEDELELLLDFTADLGYGIKAFRTRGELDITSRNLTDSESRFRVLIEKQSDGVVLVDEAGKVLLYNPAAKKLFDQRSEDLINRTFDLPHVNGPSELKIARPDKSVVHVEVHTASIRWNARPACLLELHDITERKAIEQERIEHADTLQSALEQTIAAIAQTVEKRDPYTAGHQQRVALLAREIGCAMNLSEEDLHGLYLGALIHDIGKIYIPSEILNRPGRLNKSEFELIKSHSEVGYEIIKGIKFPWPIDKMIRQHHERLDGSGYPLGLRNGEICIEARILAVADVVEAMSSHRPYRPSLGIEPALEEIQKHKGTLYEADVVDCCVHLFRDKHLTLESLHENN